VSDGKAQQPEVLPGGLLAVLACPCPEHAPVRVSGDGDGACVECTRCRTRFPIEDGVPVMLLDAATAGPSGVGIAVSGD